MLHYLKKYYSVLILIIILTSCGSQKGLLYNPSEVRQVSNKLGVELSNRNQEDDKYMPLYAEVSLWMGTPYKYGGISKSGVDCSGLVYKVYQKVYRKTLPRSTAELEKKGIKKISKNDLRPGDLVFFATSNSKNKITHVGIYLKNNKFIHASTKRGVVVNDLDENYYKQTWKKAGRIK